MKTDFFLMITREMQVNGDSLVTNLGEHLTVEGTGLNGKTEANSVNTKLAEPPLLLDARDRMK